MDRNEHSLTEREEILLERYHDGECGIIGRMRAERLLSRSSSALIFLERLQQLSEANADYASSVRRVKFDLWSKIEKRIDEEERAEFYLGKRGKDNFVEKKSGWVIDWSKAGWGLSGAFVTAVFGFALFRVASVQPVANINPDNSNILTNLGASQSGELLQAQPVKLRELPLGVGRQGGYASRPVEVDWMRSDGRVHIIQDPNDRSAIIWVKKRRVPTNRDRILSMPEDDRADRPKIINQRIPESVSISDIK